MLTVDDALEIYTAEAKKGNFSVYDTLENMLQGDDKEEFFNHCQFINTFCDYEPPADFKQVFDKMDAHKKELDEAFITALKED